MNITHTTGSTAMARTTWTATLTSPTDAQRGFDSTITVHAHATVRILRQGSPSATNSAAWSRAPTDTTMYCLPRRMYVIGPAVVPDGSSVSQITRPLALS